MAVRMTKPWRALEEASVRQLPGQLIGRESFFTSDSLVVARCTACAGSY